MKFVFKDTIHAWTREAAEINIVGYSLLIKLFFWVDMWAGRCWKLWDLFGTCPSRDV